MPFYTWQKQGKARFRRPRYEPDVTDLSLPRVEAHLMRIATLTQEARELSARADRISALRLVSFLVICVAGYTAFSQQLAWAALVAGLFALIFVVALVVHARIFAKHAETLARSAVHQRHVDRLRGAFSAFPDDGAELVAKDHPYAFDIDLVGPNSLFQRIDVSHTIEGATCLANALAAHSSLEVIRARQAAVLELADLDALREELEVRGALGRKQQKKLDHAPFTRLLALGSIFQTTPWLRTAMWGLPFTTLALYVLGELGVIPSGLYWLTLILQGIVLWTKEDAVQRVLQTVTARLGFAEAYEGMLAVIEKQEFKSPHLLALRAELRSKGRMPSEHMARLRRYEGLSQLRTQGPLYIVLNTLTLWDLFCLDRIERWIHDVGPQSERWFQIMGEIEMLCSLATLRHGDPSTSMPELTDPGTVFEAKALAHPLIIPRTRVANDVRIAGAGTAVIITGSNMAGKSTLLRAVGLNVALALAGGPVCAASLRLPVVRLRASMRIDDSLQRGASYFHAELTKLKSVVADVAQAPTVLFLLDELLRGTNARARQQGARAVLKHLITRGAMGLVATHDVALSELEGVPAGSITDQHFTDVFENGEMLFDYLLRDGPVRTSNALRLLALAGIDVPVDEKLV